MTAENPASTNEIPKPVEQEAGDKTANDLLHMRFAEKQIMLMRGVDIIDRRMREMGFIIFGAELADYSSDTLNLRVHVYWNNLLEYLARSDRR